MDRWLMMREPKTSAQRKELKKSMKRSQTPILTRSRNIFNNEKNSPLRIGALNYSPYKRDYSKTGRSGRSARRTGEDSSGIFKYDLEKELQGLSKKEKNLQRRLNDLEKEQKSLHSLVRKSERHISEALKKAQDEEDKIFSLFLDVIKEKNIKIDLGDIDEEENIPTSLTTNQKPVLSIKEVNTSQVLSNYLKSETGEENNNDLSWPMLALQRRALMEQTEGEE